MSIDAYVENMLVGTVQACPTFGGKLRHVDDAPALAVNGVKRVIQLDDAVVVLANGYWPARKGLSKLKPEWALGEHANNSSADIKQLLQAGLATATERNPLVVRQALLVKKPRHLRILNRAAKLATWGDAPAGQVQGITIAESFGSIVAEVIDASVYDVAVKIHKVTCVVDSGVAVNPDTLRAQMEGSIVYGLTVAFFGHITIANGAVREGNFDGYPMLKLAQMPPVVVEIVESEPGKPGGIREPGLPPMAQHWATRFLSRPAPVCVACRSPNTVYDQPKRHENA